MPSFRDSELALIRRAQRGDTEAVAELYRLHSPAIYRYFHFRVPDRATAEDLTGEVFVKMVEGLPRFVDRGAPLAAWLFRIAHDRVVDHHRRVAFRRSEPIGEGLEAGGPSTEAQALQRAEMDRIRAAVATLTEEQRAVIQLRFVEGYSLEQSASILGKTTGAIKALQHRALRQLAGKLDR